MAAMPVSEGYTEGWTPASFAKEFGLCFSTAANRLFRGLHDGKFTRVRGRHPDYGKRLGWVYREA